MKARGLTCRDPKKEFWKLEAPAVQFLSNDAHRRDYASPWDEKLVLACHPWLVVNSSYCWIQETWGIATFKLLPRKNRNLPSVENSCLKFIFAMLESRWMARWSNKISIIRFCRSSFPPLDNSSPFSCELPVTTTDRRFQKRVSFSMNSRPDRM